MSQPGRYNQTAAEHVGVRGTNMSATRADDRTRRDFIKELVLVLAADRSAVR